MRRDSSLSDSDQSGHSVNVLGAIALYSFAGETGTAELSFTANDKLEIYVVDASAGWSLGACQNAAGNWQRGLIPQRFYRLVDRVDRLEEKRAQEESNSLRSVQTSDAAAVANGIASGIDQTDRFNEDTYGKQERLSFSRSTTPTEGRDTRINADGHIRESVYESPLQSPVMQGANVLTCVSELDDESTDLALQSSHILCVDGQDFAIAVLTPTLEYVERRDVDGLEPATYFQDAANYQSAALEKGVFESPETEGNVSENSQPHTVSKAAAKLEKYFEESRLPGMPHTSASALPSVISKAVFTKSALESVNEIHAGPNLQPLPPVFPRPTLLQRSSSQRSAELGRKLSSHSAAVKQAARTGVKGKGRLDGGWVSSGAEAWLAAARNATHLSKTERRKLAITEAGRGSGLDEEAILIDPGPSWQAKSLPFEVRVHSPYRSGDHVIYCITSTFTGESEDEGPGQTPEMTVHRRYSHFFSLAKLLEARYRALVLPPFPPKTYTGRFDAIFLKQRELSLSHWLRVIIRHPVLRDAEPCRIFLSHHDSGEVMSAMEATSWNETLFDRIYFDEFNVDPDRLADEFERVKKHARAEQQNALMFQLSASFESLRQATVSNASAARNMAHRLFSVITDPRDIDRSKDSEHFCWRESCADCLNLTKALQVMAEAYDRMACEDERWAANDMLRVQSLAKMHSTPENHIAGLVNLYTAAASGLKAVQSDTESTEGDPGVAETIATRCETVLNVVAAELDHVHSERHNDTLALGRTLVDSHIARLQSQLNQLKRVRSHFEEGIFETLHESGPRLASTLLKSENTTDNSQTAFISPDYVLGGKSAAAGRKTADAFGIASVMQWAGSAFRPAPMPDS